MPASDSAVTIGVLTPKDAKSAGKSSAVATDSGDSVSDENCGGFFCCLRSGVFRQNKLLQPRAATSDGAAHNSARVSQRASEIE